MRTALTSTVTDHRSTLTSVGGGRLSIGRLLTDSPSVGIGDVMAVGRSVPDRWTIAGERTAGDVSIDGDLLHAGEVSVIGKVDISSVSRSGDITVLVKEESVTV